MLGGVKRRPAYPPDLARYIFDHWPSDGGELIDWELFCEALSVAFQASLTAEEARPTRFRLLLTPPERLPESGVPNEGVLRLEFDRDRPFTPDELRRLSPATPFEAGLIGSHVVDGRLRIWGMAHSGPAWLNPSWGGRSPVPNWSYDPIIHVTAPGQIAVRCAGKLIGALERGVLVDGFLDVFDSVWLPALFATERERVRREHSAMQLHAPSPTEAEHSLIGSVGQHMLRRAIQLIRNARHGGMILIVDAAGPGTPVALGGLRLKYQYRENEPAHRYRTLLFQILDRVAARTTKPSVGWNDFAHDDSLELSKLERAVFELSRLIAGLAAIDGAVVLDKRLQLVGFGAEVSSDLASPEQVWRATDLEASERQPESIENVGTRHRAAYRFAQHQPGGLAIVVSHDGSVSFVTQRISQVVYWEQSVSP
jgi:sensor domain DACNV-containing protein